MAIEASTSGIFAYEYLDEKGIEVHLAHPVYVKPFAKKHVKADKVDSEILAQLLRMDYLPESYVPEGEIRDLRTIVRHRASLVRLGTSIKNRVHGEERDGVLKGGETTTAEKDSTGRLPESSGSSELRD